LAYLAAERQVVVLPRNGRACGQNYRNNDCHYQDDIAHIGARNLLMCCVGSGIGITHPDWGA